jgi:hypothetical protein
MRRNQSEYDARDKKPPTEKNIIWKTRRKTFIAEHVTIILKRVLRKESVTVYFVKEA